ncbi:MAG: class I SAM-dependent methyltransferase [Spirochaetota bacterium]
MSKIEVIRSYYEPKIKEELPDYAKLGWESSEAQHIRFDAFLNNVNLSGKSLLDVGCGLGSLLEYITEKKTDVSYTGVDILRQMITCAQEKDLDGQFHCLDIFDTHPFGEKSFDCIYASGIFNLNLGNNREFFPRALCEFSKIAREHVAFNLLDYRSPDRDDTYFYFDPADVVSMIEDLCCRPKSIQIVEQYLNNDFTVICAM